MSLFDIFHASDIKKENERLNKILQDMGAADAVEVKKRIESLKAEEERYLKDINLMKMESDKQKKQLTDEISQLQTE